MFAVSLPGVEVQVDCSIPDGRVDGFGLVQLRANCAEFTYIEACEADTGISLCLDPRYCVNITLVL